MWKFHYLCVLFLQLWSNFYLTTLANAQYAMLQRPEQVMHLKSNRSGIHILSKLHLMPDTSIYKFSTSNVLLCIFDIVKSWKETNVIFLYRSDEDYKLFNSQFVRGQRNMNVEVLKWKEDDQNNHEYEVHYLQQKLRCFIIVCCEAFLAQEFLQMMGDTGAFVTGGNILLVTENDFPILNTNFKFQITSHLSILMPEFHKKNENVDVHHAINFNVFDVFNNYGSDGSSSETSETIKMQHREFRKVLVLKWNLFKGLSTLDIFESDSNLRMNEKIVQTGLIQFAPFAFLDKSKSCFASTGYLKDIYDVLADHLNFRMNFSCLSEQSAGIQLANGTYTGIMSLLYENKIDIGMNPMLLTKWRLRLTQVHTALQKITSAVWFKREDTSQTFSAKTHFSAFSLDVWLVFAISFFTVAFNMALVLKMNPLKTTENLSEIKLPYHKRVVHFLRWFLFGEFLEQALEFAPGITTKILLGTLNVTVTLIFLHYTSIFSSVLTSQAVTLPFTNVEELVANSNYRIGIQWSTGYQDILKNADNELYKSIWQRMIEHDDNFVADVTKGLRKVCNEDKYAFFFDNRATGYNAASSEFVKCGLHYMKFSIMETYVYASFRSDFPYASTFSNAIFRMKESGILQRLHADYFPEQGSFTQVQSNAITKQYSNAIFAFELHHIIIPIGTLVTGIILSLLVLILELTVSKMLRIPNSNPQLEVIRRPVGIWKFD